MNGIRERIIKHYLILCVITMAAGIIFYYVSPGKPVIALITDITGYAALFILAFSLVIGPYNFWIKRKNPVSTYFRRDIGIFGGVLAVIHTGTGLFVHMAGRPWLYFMKQAGESLKIRLDRFGFANDSGLLATLIIILLITISNDFFLQKLKASRWKNIQRFSYFMFIFTLIHAVLYRVGAQNHWPLIIMYLSIFIIVLLIQFSGVYYKIWKKT